MERPPTEANLLYRARLLTACIAEDRKEIDEDWKKVETALNLAIVEVEQRSGRRRLAYLFAGLVVAAGLSAIVALQTGVSVDVVPLLALLLANVAIVLLAVLLEILMPFRGGPREPENTHGHDRLAGLKRSK